MKNYRSLYEKILNSSISAITESGEIIDLDEKRDFLIKTLQSSFKELFNIHILEFPHPYIKFENVSLEILKNNSNTGGILLRPYLFKVRKYLREIKTGIRIHFPEGHFQAHIEHKISTEAFANNLARTLSHEIMHWDQSSKKGLNCKKKKLGKVQYLKEFKPIPLFTTEYYANSDEINAYALNTAQTLLFEVCRRSTTPIAEAHHIISNQALLEKNKNINGIRFYKDLPSKKIYKKFLKKVYQQISILSELE